MRFTSIIDFFYTRAKVYAFVTSLLWNVVNLGTKKDFAPEYFESKISRLRLLFFTAYDLLKNMN